MVVSRVNRLHDEALSFRVPSIRVGLDVVLISVDLFSCIIRFYPLQNALLDLVLGLMFVKHQGFLFRHRLKQGDSDLRELVMSRVMLMLKAVEDILHSPLPCLNDRL